jgi:hypothetical protein
VTRRSFLTGVALSLVACANTDEPTDPAWGKEPCAHCAMLVGDRRFAAQVGGEGERRYFDDIGCMVMWLERRAARPSRTWVREDGARWVEARTARYQAGARTPMDFGFVVAKEGVGWDELRERIVARAGSARGGA